MDIVIALVRLIHIFSAVFWAGSVFFTASILNPTVRASGAEGGRFMQRLATTGGMSRLVGAAAALTVVSGLLMYWPITSGLNVAVVFGSRLALTLGALCGIAAGAVGGMVVGRASARLAELGQQVAAQGGPPTPAQASEMGQLQGQLGRGSMITAALVALALLGMAL
jgi:uncharacterized membrane protein